jgi:hypothetical protein
LPKNWKESKKEKKMENNIVEAEEKDPIIISEGLLTADVIKKAELQVDGLNKIKEISLKITNKHDWVVMNGKPCLQNSGCMKIANLWGVSFHKPTIQEERRSDDRGEYITFTCEGEGEFRGRVVNDIGTSSTRDKLLGTVGGELKELSMVDLPSVKKMAITNWQSRILRKILGLSFTKEDLQSKGVSTENVVNHASGGAGGGIISVAQASRLYAIAKQNKWSDESLKSHLKEKFGYSSSKEIEKTKYEEIVSYFSNKGE